MGKEYGQEMVPSSVIPPRPETAPLPPPLASGKGVVYSPEDFRAAQEEEFVIADQKELKVRRAWIWAFESPEKLARLAEEYITHLETAETDKVCLCFWRIHPDDVELEAKRRKVLVDEHPNCPVHTKAGRLVGFIDWLTSPAND